MSSEITNPERGIATKGTGNGSSMRAGERQRRAGIPSGGTVRVKEEYYDDRAPTVLTHGGEKRSARIAIGWRYYTWKDQAGRVIGTHFEPIVENEKPPKPKHSTELQSPSEGSPDARTTPSTRTGRPLGSSRGLNRSADKQIRETSRRLQASARAALREEQRERARERLEREIQRERKEFITLPQELDVEMIGDRWKRVETKMRDHWKPLTATARHMFQTEKNIIKKAGENLITLMEQYIGCHRNDYFRLMFGLAGPPQRTGFDPKDFWKRFWQQVYRVRHPEWARSRYTMDDFMDWWIQGPEVFYFNVATRARVEHIDAHVDKHVAYDMLPDDLKLLWSKNQFLMLRIGVDCDS